MLREPNLLQPKRLQDHQHLQESQVGHRLSFYDALFLYSLIVVLVQTKLNPKGKPIHLPCLVKYESGYFLLANPSCRICLHFRVFLM